MDYFATLTLDFNGTLATATAIFTVTPANQHNMTRAAILRSLRHDIAERKQFPYWETAAAIVLFTVEADLLDAAELPVMSEVGQR